MNIELEEKRVVAKQDGIELGEMTFMQPNDDYYIIAHTGVSPEAKGLGVGKKMVAYFVEYVKQQNKKILPLCPFAKAEFDKNEAYQSLLVQ
jgi:predicted GNAT family acetyltransferase